MKRSSATDHQHLAGSFIVHRISEDQRTACTVCGIYQSDVSVQVGSLRIKACRSCLSNLRRLLKSAYMEVEKRYCMMKRQRRSA